MSSDLLFEIGSEELPSGAVWPLADALANNIITGLAKAGLQHGNVRRYASPRRLAIVVEGLQTVQESQHTVRRGPTYTPLSDGETPAPALLGFAKSCGVSVSALTKLSTEKGEWWAYESASLGKSTRELLPEMLKDAVKSLPVAKPMRWGDGEEEFARPVHWAVLLFGNEVISAQILGVNTGSYSYGHRFHHPKAVEITDPQMYEALLKDAFVIADFTVRRQMIVEQVEALAKQYGYRAEMPEALVDEVTSIVEWPQALIANFESDFLQVPAEALIAAMQSHQKCFALRDAEGKLVPHFITVANISSTQPNQVVQGNEKVMRARLSDAAFFFHQDKKQRLCDYRASTANVIFQKRLGSLQEKTNRMELLMDAFISPLKLDKNEAVRAAQLSKCDLMTGMVGEFPELQGLMGYYYAVNDQETESVAQSLHEQYLPRFAADGLPKSSLGLALSLVDRLDTLVGIFAIGEKPTGVKDPFKLRRHALAVVRMLIETPAPISLSTLLQCTLHTYGDSLTLKDTQMMEELRIFILERMNSYYQAHEIPMDVVLSVRARQEDWLYDVDKRIEALMKFLTLPESNMLSAACKRVNNILQQSADLIHNKIIDTNLLQEPAERALFEHIQRIEQLVMPHYCAKDYGAILTHLASLRAPVDAFFDKVLVMVDEPALKENRLCLLARLQTLLQGVADISLLQFGV